MQTACEHNRTIVLARRDGVDYVECLDCRQIFEAEDLEPVTVEAKRSNKRKTLHSTDRLPSPDPSCRAC